MTKSCVILFDTFCFESAKILSESVAHAQLKNDTFSAKPVICVECRFRRLVR